MTRARRRVAVPISDKDLVALFTQTFRYIYLRGESTCVEWAFYSDGLTLLYTRC